MEIKSNSPIRNREFFKEVETTFGKFCQAANQNAERIKNKFFPQGVPKFSLNTFIYGPDSTFINDESVEYDTMMITDSPAEIFGDEPVFHITSSQVLKDLKNGKKIIPPVFHYHEQTQTHRGIGLELWSRFCESLGFDLSNKDDFIWTGRQIDQEQLVIEENLAKKGTDVDREIINLFFEQQEEINAGKPFYVIHPNLEKVLTIIEQRERVEDEAIRKYVEDFFRKAFFLFGVRDGWFFKLRSTLLGETPLPQPSYVAMETTNILETSLDAMAQPNPGQNEAIILKINPVASYAKRKLFAFPLTDRHPEAIVPLPSVSQDEIMEIYVENPDNFDRSLLPKDTLLKSFKDLPESAWLGNRHIDNLTIDKIDPETPLCEVRYGTSATDLYRRHLFEGRIAFARTQRTEPNSFYYHLLKMFGPEIFHEDKKRVLALPNLVFVAAIINSSIKGIEAY